MTISQVNSIFCQLPKMDSVRLSGGEPFLHPDFLEIGRLVQQHLRPLSLYISTNGFLTEKIIDYLETREKSIPLHLMISLDGYSSRHDLIRGVSGAWEMALTTIKELSRKACDLNIALGAVQTLIDEEGIDDYSRLKEVLKPLNIPLRVVAAYRSSATYSSRSRRINIPMSSGIFDAMAKLSIAQWKAFSNAMIEDASNQPWASRITTRYYWRGITERMTRFKSVPNPRCTALNCHLRLLPNGDIPTCQFNSTTIGNACEQPLRSLWNGQTAEIQRRWIRECPGCWAECEIIPNAIYSADLIRYL